MFSQEIYKDTAIYYSDLESGEPRGSRRAGAAAAAAGTAAAAADAFSMNQWPQVTFMSRHDAKSPDETAQGAWLDLVDQAGLLVSDGAHQIPARRPVRACERIEEDGQRDSTSRTLLRVAAGAARPAGGATEPATNGGAK